MRHVIILATARTGGTWFGKVLDTSPHVKYLWEPDSPRRNIADRIRQWPIGDKVSMRERIEKYIPHQSILPEFPKKRITTAVYKLTTPLWDAAQMIDAWEYDFLQLRKKLDAQVIHLMRHPARWAASVKRWGDHPLEESIPLYSERNVEFWKTYKGAAWYKAVKHEEAVEIPCMIFGGIMENCRIVYSIEFFRFVREMHSRDERSAPDQHSCIMTPQTVLGRWKDLNKKELAWANDAVDEYWQGTYERLIRTRSK